jgi:hypothetical protein
METKANKLVMIGLMAAMLILTSDGRTKPTLVAPGVDIISCRAWDTEIGEPVDDYYITVSGTSMSTPYTAGAAALLLQANPDLTPAGVKAALTTTAVKLDNTKGHDYEEFYQGTGEIDAYQAYLAVNNDPLALAGIVPDRWIAGVWAYTGLAYGADRPTKKVYAVSPGCEDFAKFVFATDRELSGVTITTSGTAGDWIIVQPLPDSIPANGQETCYATLTVPDGATSGMYTGNVTISGDEGTVLSVPVTVNIAQSVAINGGMGVFNGSLDDCEWEYFYFDVPASTERLEVALKDYAGDSDLILFTPRHECIDRNQRSRTDTDTEIVENPSAGRWMAIVYGDDISETTTFNGTVAIYKVTCTPTRWNPGVLKPDDITSQSFSVANDGIRLSNALLDAIMLNITEAHRFEGSLMEQENVSEYFTVPSGLDQFELTVKCDDVEGMVYLELRDPNGNYADYAHLESGVARLRVTEPIPGRWQITVYCGYLPPYTESVSFRGAVDLYRHETCDWISFDNDTIGTLPSGSGANFTATMSLPDSVEPGDYAAAIEISSDQETFDIPVSFVVRTPLFSGIGPDQGNDTDGDGLHDYLTVNVSLNSGILGEYQLRGRLEDGTGNYLWAETTIEATGEDQTVQIAFEGTSIWKNRINDTYSIYLYMYSRRGDLLDRGNYTTAHYNYTEFQPLPAIFTDVYSDNGVDTDGDGLYDYLVIDVGVDVVDAGNYDVRATLYEHGGMPLDNNNNRTYLNSGNQTVQLKFYGLALRQNGYDGRYDLQDLGLYNTTYSNPYPVPPIPVPIPMPEEPEEPENITALYEEVDHREIAYTTAYYNHTDFQRPPVEFTGNFTDYGLDTDNDTLYDYLVIDVEVNVRKAGMFELYGSLEYHNEASGRHEWLSSDWNTTYLEPGIRNITLRFDGVRIYNVGCNGSFETRLNLRETEEWYVLDETSCSTGKYNHTDFQRPPAEFTGNFSDYGLDTDNDTLYDYLVIEAEVNVTKAGMFELYGSLEYYDEVNGWHRWLGSDRNTTHLESGIRNITLRFYGAEIYNAEYNGSFDTWLNLREVEERYTLADVKVSTSNYNYTDFQRPPAEFTGNFTDYGLDTDNDTLYDYLVIEAEVNVEKAGEFELQGSLEYHDEMSGWYGWIGSDRNTTYLESGIRNITLRFYGAGIYNAGYNGSFETWLTLLAAEERYPLDETLYPTGNYNYTDFCSEYPPGDTAIVTIASASAQPNSTTTTQITISNITNFAATTLALHYDPAVVHVTSITDDTTGILFTSIDNKAGEASLSVFADTPFGLDSPIALADIELLAVGRGGETSPLTIEIVNLFDIMGDMVPATAVSGVFVVNTGPGGDINNADAVVTLKLAASGGWDPAMDVDGDGRVTSLDALMLLKAAAGVIEP